MRPGEASGYKRTTNRDGTFNDNLELKFGSFKGSNATLEAKVIVSKVTREEKNAVALELTGKAEPEFDIKFELVRKHNDSIDVAVTTDYLFQNELVPTEAWKVPSNEMINEHLISKVLGFSQISFFNFLHALDDISSIVIRNVDKMLDYAENFGKSLKNGEDIAQLRRQAENMKGNSSASLDSNRYVEIFEQFINALINVAGNA